MFILSNVLMISGCDKAAEKILKNAETQDNNSAPDSETPETIDNSIPKENVVYGNKINDISSYYVVNDKDKISYFHENNTWFGMVENSDGETQFSFSDDLKQLTLSNEKQNYKVEINQIDENNISQNFYKYSGEKIASFLYYKQAEKMYMAQLDDIGQIDEKTKQDITAQYGNALTKINDVTSTSLLASAKQNIHNLPIYAKQTLNDLMLARSFSQSKNSQCGISSALDSAWQADWDTTVKELTKTYGPTVFAVGVTTAVCFASSTTPGLQIPCIAGIIGTISLSMKTGKAATISQNTQANQILTKNINKLRPKVENVLEKPITIKTKVDSYVTAIQNYGTNLVAYSRQEDSNGIKRWVKDGTIICDDYDIGFNLDFMTTWSFDPVKRTVTANSSYDGDGMGSSDDAVGYFNPLTGYFKFKFSESDDEPDEDGYGYIWKETGTVKSLEGYLDKDRKINITWNHEVIMERVSGSSNNPDYRLDGSWRSCGVTFDWKLTYQ